MIKYFHIFVKLSPLMILKGQVLYAIHHYDQRKAHLLRSRS